MKPLIILSRIVFVGLIWSILFLEGIRVIMLTNWHFDVFQPAHWLYAWNLWLSGWLIDTPKEWAFILIILTFIPIWLTGWTGLSLVKWGHIFGIILRLPFGILKKTFEKQVKKLADTASVKAVKKKKSYKEIRPRSIRPPLEDSAYTLPADKRSALTGAPAKKSAAPRTIPIEPSKPKEFEHSLFKLDTDPVDFDFDLFDDKPKIETPASAESKPASQPVKKESKPAGKVESPPAAPRGSSNSTLEILKQRGYEIITAATIKNTLIDFIGVSASTICLCLNDKEPGDWLADEERFNDEEPLWFSESSHRISPVRKIDVARTILSDKLSAADMNFKIEAFVIEQIGNIINAEDMFDIWSNMNINVTRIDRGTPKEIRLFAKALEEVDEKIDKERFEKLKKLIRSIA